MEDNKTHVFCQEDPDGELFGYGTGKYTKSEVDTIITLLPKNHEVIRIVWVTPDEYKAAEKLRNSGNKF